jgi:ribonuclease HIII
MHTGSYRLQASKFDSVKGRLVDAGFSVEGRPPIEAASSIATSGPRIGLGLAGSGDFFGPLVVVGVFATEAEIRLLREAHLDDPKYWKTRPSYELAARIRGIVGKSDVAYVTIMPRKYNLLVPEMGGQKAVIAWAQRNCVGRLLMGGEECSAISGRELAEPAALRDMIARRSPEPAVLAGRAARDEPVVAAASIVAHAGVTRGRARLERRYAIRLPSGARDVLETARFLVASHGEEMLPEVAKMDFRTAEEVFENLRPES